MEEYCFKSWSKEAAEEIQSIWTQYIGIYLNKEPVHSKPPALNEQDDDLVLVPEMDYESNDKGGGSEDEGLESIPM